MTNLDEHTFFPDEEMTKSIAELICCVLVDSKKNNTDEIEMTKNKLTYLKEREEMLDRRLKHFTNYLNKWEDNFQKKRGK